MKQSVRLVLPLAGLALVAAAAPAGADPVNAPNATRVPISCDNGNTYDAVVNGEGDFAPAHDTNSTKVLVPLSFGEFTGTITDANGGVVDSFTDPAMTKGKASKKQRRTQTSCTYTFSGTFEDPDLGTLTFAGTGDVTGFVTPAGHAKG
jgi:hypothetical protein